METGCQNVNLCFAILKVTFPPEVIGPMFLFPLLYFTFQLSEALLLTVCFRCYQRSKTPADGKRPSCLFVFLPAETRGVLGSAVKSLIFNHWSSEFRSNPSLCVHS